MLTTCGQSILFQHARRKPSKHSIPIIHPMLVENGLLGQQFHRFELTQFSNITIHVSNAALRIVVMSVVALGFGYQPLFHQASQHALALFKKELQ